MKKILTVLTIVALVASSVFAGFSGEASLGYTHDLDSKNSGFANGTKFKVDLDFATASAEKQAEGDIYAKISASLALKLYNGNDGTTSTGVNKVYPLYFNVSDIKASINGANWSLDILEVPGRLDLAKSAIDSSEVYKEDDDYGYDKANYDDPTTYAVGFKKAPGFGFTYAGYTVGLGFQYKDKDGSLDADFGQSVAGVLQGKIHESYAGVDFTAVAKTPEIEVLDGLKIQGGASYFLNETAGAKYVVDKTQKGIDKETKLVTDRGSAVGGSVAVGFEKDKFAIKVATDLGYTIEAYDVNYTSADYMNASIVKNAKASEKFSMDVAGNVKYDFISADGYMKIDGTEWDNGKRGATLVSGQVVTDLNTFDVPVKLTVSAKDILKTVNLGVKAEFAVIDGLTLTAKTGYVINTVDAYNKDKWVDDVFMGQWSVGLDAEYAFDYATVKAGVSAKNLGYAAVDTEAEVKALNPNMLANMKTENDLVNQVLLGLSASVETDSIIPGATLSLSWDDASDLLGLYKLNDADVYGNGGHTNLGSITAKCKVTF